VFCCSALESIQIPNSVEKLGNKCFQFCSSLSEVTFELGSLLKEIGMGAFFRSPLESVKIEEGFDIKYNGPEMCRIEYISNVDKRDAKSNISDYPTNLDKEYRLIKRVSQKVRLWRKLNSNEEVAVKIYEIEERKEDNIVLVQNTFFREIEALFTLKHPCILSLKGYSLPRGYQREILITEFMRKESLNSVLASGSCAP
jgi:serine/threonine protein kinase